MKNSVIEIHSPMKIKTFVLLLLTTLFACNQEDDPKVEYDPTLYVLDYGHFPNPNLPADNLLTNAGVELGRMLFYEKALSRDRSMACADCHQQKDMFSDSRQFSIGVDSLPGKRQAMPVSESRFMRRSIYLNSIR